MILQGSNMKKILFILLFPFLLNGQGFFLNILSEDKPDVTAPGLPTSIAAVGATGKVTLTWVDPIDTDLDSVNVYRGTSTNPTTFLARIYKGVQTYKDTGSLARGTNYFYRLKTVDVAGNLSAYSSNVNDTANYISYSRTLAKVDYEEANRSDFTDSTKCYANATTLTISAFDTLTTYSAKVSINSTSPFPAFGKKTFTEEDDSVSGAFWIYLSSSLNVPEASNYGQMYFFTLWDATSTNDILYIGVKWNNATPKVIYHWDFICTDGSSNVSSPGTPVFNKWTKIEWQYLGNTASTGGMKVWIDDVLTYDYMAHTTTNVKPDYFTIGLTENNTLTWSASTAYYYIGDAVVCGGFMPNFTGF